MAPFQYAQAYRASAREKSIFTKEWDQDAGPFKSVGFRLEDDHKDGRFTTHNLLIANDTTGTLYIFIFEAPTAEWDEAWKIGEPILQRLFIDSDV